MGRKSLSGKPKLRRIVLRVTDEEWDRIDYLADAKPLSTWLRDLGLSQPDPPKSKRKPKA